MITLGRYNKYLHNADIVALMHMLNLKNKQSLCGMLQSNDEIFHKNP